MVLVFAFLCRSVGLGNDLWFLVKNIAKGASQVSGHSLKTTFLYVSNITSEAQ
jgi:hypothetical protein